MAVIENRGFVRPEEFSAEICKMHDGSLVAQQIAQQGAIHAVGYFLKHGCTRALAEMMLVSLRENMRIVRVEAERRGISLFEEDQTGFN